MKNAQPVQRITDERRVRHAGLDAEGSAMLNDLDNGIEVGEGRLALAMTEKSQLRLKPQNLLASLPLAPCA